MKKSMFAFCLSVFVVVSMMFSGCKKFDTPRYKEIEPSQTAFVIPLEGDASKQAKFESAEALKRMQVAAKRVQITHRWNKTGRMWYSGDWMDNISVVLVERKPESREWTAETSTGTVAKDQGIWAESKDSVGFSTGITISAMIEEPDAALFLYRYPTGSLANALDNEVRSRVQALFSDFAAGYDMSDLRDKKVEIIQKIKGDVVPFFKEWGITITSLGMTGGFTYENTEIQKAIDGVFIAQREKEVAKALLEAQKDKNSRIEQEATATANKERSIAQGVADGKSYILAVAKQAAQDPVFVQLRQLEVEEARITKWDGKYPVYYMGMGSSTGGPNLLLNVPSPVSTSTQSVQK